MSIVQYCFTSTETIRLVRTESPGQPPRLSHSSRTIPFYNVIETCFSGTFVTGRVGIIHNNNNGSVVLECPLSVSPRRVQFILKFKKQINKNLTSKHNINVDEFVMKHLNLQY